MKQFIIVAITFSSFIFMVSSTIEGTQNDLQKYENIFTNIYKKNLWGDPESVSGSGSSLKSTQAIRLKIPCLLKEYKIRSLLDIPCGDFNWMRTVDLGETKYLGADIVRDLVEKNSIVYGSPTRAFLHLNALCDALPEVDLIFCRDMLVHLGYKEIRQALTNFKKSGAKYILMTTFLCKEMNTDLLRAGLWRKINFEMAPFNFPEPLVLIHEENFHEKDAEDKYLGLWVLEDLVV